MLRSSAGISSADVAASAWTNSGGSGTTSFATSDATPPGMVAPYYDRLGFHGEGRSYVLDL